MKRFVTDRKFEFDLHRQGYRYVVGLDEVGRGPWAGPVAVGAVLFAADHPLIEGITDSKALRIGERSALADTITSSALASTVILRDNLYIDTHGLTQSIHSAMVEAVQEIERQIAHPVDFTLVDGRSIKPLGHWDHLHEDKGDAIHYCVAAASIIAKHHRDSLMIEYSKQYPQYGFDKHMGYGTKRHREALAAHGVTPIHRRSFKPIRDLLI